MPQEGATILSQVFEIDQATYARVLDFNIETRKNVIALGMAGTGKSEMAFQAAERMGFQYKYLDLSVLEAPDLIGLPVIEMDKDGGKYVDYATPKFLPRYNKDEKPYVLIVDEIDKTKPELQNPLLELFQFLSINGNKLGIQAIIATGNLPEEGAFSQPISHALTNRCKVYKLTCSFESWREWAQNANINPLIIGFLSKNREFLSQPSVEGDPTAYCRPSPRSWSEAARELDFTDPKKHSVDFQSMLVAGRVGTAAALKFRVWLDYYRHVEPVVEALWERGAMPDMKDMTIDRQLVCAISAVDMVSRAARETVKTEADKKKRHDDVQKGAKNVFAFMKQLTSELQIGALKSALSMPIIQEFKLTTIPDVMATYMKVRSAIKD